MNSFLDERFALFEEFSGQDNNTGSSISNLSILKQLRSIRILKKHKNETYRPQLNLLHSVNNTF